MSDFRRWARLHATGNRQRIRNWLNRRALDRGRAPLPDRMTRPLSSLPVYRNRVNPATGRPRRDDGRINQLIDRDLARRAPQRSRGRSR
jgi:hypothetical protein